MAKKLTIDVNKGALGSGFFSNSASVQQNDETIPEPEVKPVDSQPEQPKEKKRIGRPKQAKKKAQYTLTMDPDLYQRLRAKAEAKCTSFSQLVTDCMLEYLEKN
jgi:predicted HicB family RNase H-like nuclease